MLIGKNFWCPSVCPSRLSWSSKTTLMLFTHPNTDVKYLLNKLHWFVFSVLIYNWGGLQLYTKLVSRVDGSIWVKRGSSIPAPRVHILKLFRTQPTAQRQPQNVSRALTLRAKQNIWSKMAWNLYPFSWWNGRFPFFLTYKHLGFS